MILREFNPSVYPYKIWVAIDKEPYELCDKFYERSGKDIKFVEEDGHGRNEAFVMQVMKKDDMKYGSVIYFRSKRSMTHEIVAHEACHAAKDLFEHIGADIAPHEPFEYLLGWIVDCCYKTKNIKRNEK